MKAYLKGGRAIAVTVLVSLAVLAVTAAPAASAAPAICPGLPVARSFKATNITSTTATLNGSVSGSGGVFSYYFQYGRSIYLGHSTVPQGPAQPSPQFISASVTITGLRPNTGYYFRFNASNSAATTFGAVLMFRTAPSSATHGARGSAAVSRAQSEPVAGAQTQPVAAAPAACPPFAPTAQSGPATNRGPTTATLTGTYTWITMPFTVYFQYGPTIYLGQQSGGSGPPPNVSTLPTSATIIGLKPHTTYYYRLVVSFSNSGNLFTPSGIRYGATVKFKTT